MAGNGEGVRAIEAHKPKTQHRGLLREEQARALQAQERQEAAAVVTGSGREADDAESATPAISEKLAKREA